MSTLTTPQSPRAFGLSLLLHVLVVVALVVIGWYAREREEPPVQIFELVAGEGDDYMAKEAPTTDATPPTIKLPPMPEPVVPQPPAPKIQPVPEPKQETPPPPKKEPTPTPKKETPPPTPKAEKKTPPPPKVEKAPERVTIDQFRKEHGAPKTPTPKAPRPIATKKIDLSQLGRVASTQTNTAVTGGGGDVMTRQEMDQWAAYQALLQRKVREAMLAAGFTEIRTISVEVRISAQGALSAPSITRSSGSGDFDTAVLTALRSIRMPPPPSGRTEVVRFPIEFRERV